MDCVEVCPVDCFYEGENMLVIHPDECIDCGVCVPECPVDAIKPDTDPGLEEWLSLNAKYAKIWPNITVSSARFLLGSMLTRAISADLSGLYCGLFVGIPGIAVERQSDSFVVRDPPPLDGQPGRS